MRKDQDKQKDGKKKNWLFLLVFFLFSLVCILLSVLCLNGMQSTIVQRWKVLWIILISMLVICLYACCIWSVIKGKNTLIRTLFTFYVFLVFCLIFTLVLQRTGFFVLFKDSNRLQEYIQKAGIWMPLFYILLQFLQVVILPIPSIVSTVAGVALFGPLKAMIYSLLGIVSGSLLAFYIGRRFGNKAVAWMVGEEALKKWQKKLKGKDNFFLTLMFLLPLFPDDILCFLAGLSTMTWRYFILMIFITRSIGIAGTCYSIDFIPFNTWWGILIWVALLIGAALAIYFIYKNMDKIQVKLKERAKRRRKNGTKK